MSLSSLLLAVLVLLAVLALRPWLRGVAGAAAWLLLLRGVTAALGGAEMVESS